MELPISILVVSNHILQLQGNFFPPLLMSETHLSCPENGEDHCILLVCPFSPHTPWKEKLRQSQISQEQQM